MENIKFFMTSNGKIHKLDNLEQIEQFILNCRNHTDIAKLPHVEDLYEKQQKQKTKIIDHSSCRQENEHSKLQIVHAIRELNEELKGIKDQLSNFSEDYFFNQNRPNNSKDLQFSDLTPKN